MYEHEEKNEGDREPSPDTDRPKEDTKHPERKLGSAHPPDRTKLRMTSNNQAPDSPQRLPRKSVYNRRSSSFNGIGCVAASTSFHHSSDAGFFNSRHVRTGSVGPIRAPKGKFTVHKMGSKNIHNSDALKCNRLYMRRNALCDPFRLLMPQHTRERIEKDVEKRRTSVARKVSTFVTMKLDLDREEDLI